MVERTVVDELDAAPHAEVFEERVPRTVRLQLDAGDSIPAHSHPERDVVLYVIEGAIDLALDGETHRVSAGTAMQFVGEREIEPTAVEDARALLVLAATA